MRCFRFWGLLLLVPALVCFLTIGGCGKKDDKKKGDSSAQKDDEDEKDEDGKGKGDEDKGKKAKKDKEDEGGDEDEDVRTELNSTGWGTLKGKVTLAGAVPERKVIVNAAQLQNKSDLAECQKGDTKDQTWMVSKDDKGVQNVVVWLVPPKGKCFKLPEGSPWRKEVTIDQPHCAFIPHVEVVFPRYYDAKKKKMVPSGQTFKILNSAPLAHNTRWKGTDTINPRKSETLPAKKGDKPTELEIKLLPDKQPIELNCDFHKFMNGYVWAFDHPYATVTDEKGNYEIKNVPTGAKLRVVAWHEDPKFINGKNGEEMTLKKGENKKDFKIEK
jgi:hypothetical protein